MQAYLITVQPAEVRSIDFAEKARSRSEKPEGR
jgi:hypothetical protein